MESVSLNGHFLPTEILQSVFLLLDIESFYFVSTSCRVWRSAALSTLLLRRQLGDVPALSKTALESVQNASLDDLESLLQRICRGNLIGMRRNTTFKTKSSPGLEQGDIPVRSTRGCHTARLRGMTLALHLEPSSSSPSKNSNTTPANGGEVHELDLSPSIFPTSDAVRQIIGYNHGGAFFRPRSFARIQVAISSCGGLVAVALGRKVHIYSIRSGLGMEFVEGSVSEDVLDSVQKVEFAEGGLLRVEVDASEGGYVRYFGYGNRDEDEKLAYWEKALQKVYLDSRTIEQGLGGGASIRALRSIKSPSGSDSEEQKYFLALLRRGSHENTYVVGQVSQDGAVEIVQRLPTRRATFDMLDKTGTTEPALDVDRPASSGVIDRWDDENLPRAHCYDPFLSLSEDGKILAIAEPPHGKTQGGVYVCAFSPKVSEKEGEPECAAWPLMVSPLDQPIDGLQMSSTNGPYTFDVQTQRQNTTSGSQMIQWAMSNAPKC